MPHFTPPPAKLRADELLAMRGLVDSRTVAQRLIRAGKVTLADGTPVSKPSQKLPLDTELVVIEAPRFVSQGGNKLEAWMSAFPTAVAERPALDVGVSTGGFTDCLLQRGAAHVTGIDVGHGQLHPRLRQDNRVVLIEGVNAKTLDPIELPHPTYPLVVVDLSFISLKKVLRPIWNRVAIGGTAILLVKPQFEVPRPIADRDRGVIRSDQHRQAALTEVLQFIRQHLPDVALVGQIECPIPGGDGNRVLGLQRRPPSG